MQRNRLRAIAAGAVVAAAVGGGAAYATSTDDHQIGGAGAKRARAAAERYLGSGHAGSVELDGEHGAKYDVEVHRGGKVVDVWLDAGFRPVASEVDEEGG
jgi:hypothetical protein